MDYLDLPMVTGRQTIGATIGAMRAAGTSAIVVNVDSEYRLVRNVDLVGSGLGPKARVDKVAAFGARTITIKSHENRWQSELDASKAQLGVVRLGPKAARLVTRHEYLAQLVRSTQPICQCTGDGHFSTSPPAHDGQQCAYGDGVYECF